MKVSEAIQILNKMPQNSDIFIEDGEGNPFYLEDIENVGNNHVFLSYGTGKSELNHESLYNWNSFNHSFEDSKDETNFDSEIAETLRLAGVQLNENSDSFYSSCIVQHINSHPDSNIYIQANDEFDNGQEPNEDKIVQSVKYIAKKYKTDKTVAAEAYAMLTDMNASEILKIMEDDDFKTSLDNYAFWD